MIRELKKDKWVVLILFVFVCTLHGPARFFEVNWLHPYIDFSAGAIFMWFMTLRKRDKENTK